MADMQQAAQARLAQHLQQQPLQLQQQPSHHRHQQACGGLGVGIGNAQPTPAAAATGGKGGLLGGFGRNQEPAAAAAPAIQALNVSAGTAAAGVTGSREADLARREADLARREGELAHGKAELAHGQVELARWEAQLHQLAAARPKRQKQQRYAAKTSTDQGAAAARRAALPPLPPQLQQQRQALGSGVQLQQQAGVQPPVQVMNHPSAPPLCLHPTEQTPLGSAMAQPAFMYSPGQVMSCRGALMGRAGEALVMAQPVPVQEGPVLPQPKVTLGAGGAVAPGSDAPGPDTQAAPANMAQGGAVSTVPAGHVALDPSTERSGDGGGVARRGLKRRASDLEVAVPLHASSQPMHGHHPSLPGSVAAEQADASGISSSRSKAASPPPVRQPPSVAAIRPTAGAAASGAGPFCGGPAPPAMAAQRPGGPAAAAEGGSGGLRQAAEGSSAKQSALSQPLPPPFDQSPPQPQQQGQQQQQQQQQVAAGPAPAGERPGPAAQGGPGSGSVQAAARGSLAEQPLLPQPPQPLSAEVPQQQQQQQQQQRQPRLASEYKAYLMSIKDPDTFVWYQHVLKGPELQQAPPSLVPPRSAVAVAAGLAQQQQQQHLAAARPLPDMPAGQAAPPVAAQQQQHQQEPPREDEVVVLGRGATGVVYLMQQVGDDPDDTKCMDQVAMKLPYIGRMHYAIAEEEVMLLCRGRGLDCVVDYLGQAWGREGEDPVVGFLYEYCPGGDLGAWCKDRLWQEAHQRSMQQAHPAAAEAVIRQRTLERQLQGVSYEGQTVLYAAMVAPLRQHVLEGVLKGQFRQLLQVVVQMSSSGVTSTASAGASSSASSVPHLSGSSNTGPATATTSTSSSSSCSSINGAGMFANATVPLGLILHLDIKQKNIFVANGCIAVLGDFGSAQHFPDASCEEVLKPTSYTIRYCAPEALMAAAPPDPPLDGLRVRPVKVCEDGGKVDTYGLLVTLLHALSAVPVYWWAFTDPAASSADLELAEMWRFISKHQDHTEMCRALVHYYTPLLSRAALDFVKEVLVLDPSSRPTPAQVLAHPYLKEEPAAAG